MEVPPLPPPPPMDGDGDEQGVSESNDTELARVDGEGVSKMSATELALIESIGARYNSLEEGQKKALLQHLQEAGDSYNSVDSELDEDKTRPAHIVQRDGIQSVDTGHGRMRPALPITVGDQLGLAAEKDDVVKVKRLLKRGVSPDSTCSASGVTPLGVAAERGHLEIVRLLLDAKATVDVLTHDGLTALHISSQFGKDAVIDMLCERGADPNRLCGYHGLTPLMYATQRNLVSTTRLLIRHTADVNVVGGRDKGTALHLACSFGHVEVLHVLLEPPDVDVLIKNRGSEVRAARGALDRKAEL